MDGGPDSLPSRSAIVILGAVWVGVVCAMFLFFYAINPGIVVAGAAALVLMGVVSGAGFIFMVRRSKAADAAGRPWTTGRMLSVALITSAVAVGVAIPTTMSLLDLDEGSGPPASFASLVVPEGFSELPPGSWDVGEMGYMEAARVLAPEDPDAADSYLQDTGFERGWSRHWIRGDISSDSLVIRVFEFGTARGAREFAVPESVVTASTSIPEGVHDARITRVYAPEASSGGGPPTGPHRVLGIGRRCKLVATVFFRSAEDVHPDEEVAQLLRRVLDGDTTC